MSADGTEYRYDQKPRRRVDLRKLKLHRTRWNIPWKVDRDAFEGALKARSRPE